MLYWREDFNLIYSNFLSYRDTCSNVNNDFLCHKQNNNHKLDWDLLFDILGTSSLQEVINKEFSWFDFYSANPWSK